MKKTFLMFMGIFVLLGMAGCSNTTTKSTPKSHIKIEHKQSKTPYYQELKKADQKKVNFNFIADQNDYGYFISAKITNKTNKTIKFDSSKFALKLADKNVPAALTSIFILKPNQTKKLSGLFQKQSVKELIQTNNFITYSHKIKLASTRSMFSTEDLNVLNQTFNTTSDQSNNTEQQNESDNTSDSQTTPSDNSSTNTTELTEAQARQKLADSGYGDTSELKAERGDGCWNLYNGLGTWFVYDNGDVSYPGNRALNQYLKDHPDENIGDDTDDSDSDDTE